VIPPGKIMSDSNKMLLLGLSLRRSLSQISGFRRAASLNYCVEKSPKGDGRKTMVALYRAKNR
jgi:hypothetical protein